MRATTRTAIVLGIAVLVLTAIVAPAAAGRPGCLVSNERTEVGARSLQAGLDAALPGDTLVVTPHSVLPPSLAEAPIE